MFALTFNHRSAKTFRPKKNTPVGSKASFMAGPMLFALLWNVTAGLGIHLAKLCPCLRFVSCLQGLQLKRHIEATLGSGNIMEAVKLPPGVWVKAGCLGNGLLPYVKRQDVRHGLFTTTAR
jgi:hypothetical protein